MKSSANEPSIALNKGFPKHVRAINSHELLTEYTSDKSGKKGALPLGIAVPRSTDEVRDVIQWAVKTSTPLVPVSSKGERQYGDTILDKPSVILDLCELNNVLNVDGPDAVAIVEAGVTFEQLDAALEPHGLRSFRPLFVRNAKSVLAAFLDRTPITVTGRHWDCADPLAAMEMVFGTGELFRTGTAALPGTLDKKIEQGNSIMYGMGPAHTDFGRLMQGSQGSLGVVTWASLHCQRIPSLETAYFVSSDDLEGITDLLYRHFRRRMEGQVFLINALQFMLLFGIDPDSAEASAVPKWIAYIELSAHEYFPEEQMAFRTADLKRDAAVYGVDMTEKLAEISASNVLPMQQKYAFSTPTGAKQCEFFDVFCLSQLSRLPEQLAALKERNLDDAAIYIQPLVHGVNAHLQLTYLDTNSSARSAKQKSVEAATCLADTGGFFSRPYYPWGHIPFERDTSIGPMLEKAKQLFDPAGVLKPGSLALGGNL